MHSKSFEANNLPFWVAFTSCQKILMTTLCLEVKILKSYSMAETHPKSVINSTKMKWSIATIFQLFHVKITHQFREFGNYMPKSEKSRRCYDHKMNVCLSKSVNFTPHFNRSLIGHLFFVTFLLIRLGESSLVMRMLKCLVGLMIVCTTTLQTIERSRARPISGFVTHVIPRFFS